MSKFLLNEKILNILEEEKIYRPFIEDGENGIILCSYADKRIAYINREGKRITGLFCGDYLNKSIEDSLIYDVIKNDAPVERDISGMPVKMWKHITEKYMCVLIKDLSKTSEMEIFANKVIEMNRELIEIFNNYGDETLIITDGEGIVEFAGEKISETCGVPVDEFIGKNVYDLEEEGVFRPSVTAKVIERKSPQVVMQKTKTGAEFVSVGAPIIDKNGNIDKIVSVTRSYLTQMNISRLIAETGLDASNILSKPEALPERDRLITCDSKMFDIKATIRMVANTNATVLITGETGTGKELVAKYIYMKSDRKNKPFIKINCGSISPTIIESELFGYEEGAFTGARKGGKIGLIEAANGGTLFLDEISELPVEHQVKILHVLQERVLVRVGGVEQIPLNIRIIAATNKNLWECVQKGDFREDLYYRLNIIPINIPALRERKEDIPLLTKHFFETFCKEYKKEIHLSDKALQAIKQYHWPGNIRQLENTIERMILTSAKRIIGLQDIPKDIMVSADETYDVSVDRVLNMSDATVSLEKQLIRMAIDEYGTTTEAAKALGLNQSTVSRKMVAYGIKKKKATNSTL